MPPAPQNEEVLRAISLTKSYAGVRALRNACLELRRGEVHALVGENGAGKSTLMRIITGATAADGGELRLFGETIHTNSPALAKRLGIVAIHQQPQIFPDLSVAENIALVLEQVGRQYTVNWKRRNWRAKQLLEAVGSGLDPARQARTLSMAEQQLVEIAKAVGAEARILLMDEPTTLLSEREVVRLFQLIRQLRESGVAIVYISHRMDEILSIADRITVLRDGETVGVRERSTVDRQELIQLMVGRPLASVFPKREVSKGDVALEVRGLNNPEVGLSNINFTLRRGEILGFAGLIGSGRTELARTIYGLTPVDAEIFVDGRRVRLRSPAEAIAAGIAYLPEDRRRHGLVLEMSVAENITLADLKEVSRIGLLDRTKETLLADHYRDRLRIKTPDVMAAAGSLSGGNQQKVALARWLAVRPRVLILDEPTQGVDVGSKSEIHELMMQLAEEGMAVILISSELPEVMGMSDRVAVFHQGRIAGVLERGELTQERLMMLAFGHGAEVAQA
jgi:rhamnose transport system ATP-binding protein